MDFFSAETFHDSRRLHILKLAGNNISSIDNCALCNTTLEELDVSSNAMTDINENMFSWVNIPKSLLLQNSLHVFRLKIKPQLLITHINLSLRTQGLCKS